MNVIYHGHSKMLCIILIFSMVAPTSMPKMGDGESRPQTAAAGSAAQNGRAAPPAAQRIYSNGDLGSQVFQPPKSI